MLLPLAGQPDSVAVEVPPVMVGAPDRVMPVANVSAMVNAAVAVSYTHLRAHETVLDLVCRLLLEKKKTHEHTTDRDKGHI